MTLQFARDGVTRIAGLDISAEGLEGTAKELLQECPGVDFLKLKADLTKEAEVEDAIKQVVDKFGRIDYAVNNAGIGQKLAPTSETTLEEFDRVIAVNLRGVYICEKHELRQMEKQTPIETTSRCVLSTGSRFSCTG